MNATFRGEHMKKGLIAAACFGVLLVSGTTIFAQKAGDADKGKMIFDDQCSVCHNSDSEETKVGPGLKGLFKHEKLKNGKAVNEANVRAFISAGGNGMPAYGDLLSDEEKANVIAFLKSL
jgi:mono/diheme cytochrome c family protein